MVYASQTVGFPHLMLGCRIKKGRSYIVSTYVTSRLPNGRSFDLKKLAYKEHRHKRKTNVQPNLNHKDRFK